MTTLIVLLPSCDSTLNPAQWQLPMLPFTVLDRNHRVIRSGQAALSVLPRVNNTIVMVAARDVLMCHVSLPSLKGTRLKYALMHSVEEKLLQDPRACHIALDPQKVIEEDQAIQTQLNKMSMRTLAVMNWRWLQFIQQMFSEAGHHHIRAVPLTRCLPVSNALEMAVLTYTHLQREESLELAWSRPVVIEQKKEKENTAQNNPNTQKEEFEKSNEWNIKKKLKSKISKENSKNRTEEGGLCLPKHALEETLCFLQLPEMPLSVYRLMMPGETTVNLSMTSTQSDAPKSLSFESVAQSAVSCGFNLYQFDFIPPFWRMFRDQARQWRLPLMFLFSAVLVLIIGVNAHWMVLKYQHNALSAQQTEILLRAFPKITAVDPPKQMTQQLNALSAAAGELVAGDFLILAQNLYRALAPLSKQAIEMLEYHDQVLEIKFKSTIKMEPTEEAFKKRLAKHGLEGRYILGKWTIKSRS